MVEKMLMLRLLMAKNDSPGILDSLQKLGVVHIEESGIDASMMPIAEQAGLNAFKKTAKELEARVKSEAGPAATLVTALPDDATAIHEAATVAFNKLSVQKNEAEKLENDLEVLLPWGGYNPGIIRSLEAEGLKITLHAQPVKIFDSADPGDHHFEIIERTRNTVHFAELRSPGSGPDAPMFPEERLPGDGVEYTRRALDECREEIEDLEHQLCGLATGLPVLLDEIGDLESALEREMAALALSDAAGGNISMLTGYVPESLRPELEQYLAEQRIVPVFTEPENAADTPIRLRNNPISRLFEPITTIFGLPQYTEIDTTPFLAPFFAFFFGMCLADVGYGIIVSIASLAAFFILKKPAARRLAALGFILGLMTILGGLLLNTLFGTHIDGLPGLPPGIASMLLFRDLNDAMAFSIFLGVFQILFGFIMQMVNKTRQSGFISALQPAGTFLFLSGIVIAGIASMNNPAMSIGPMPLGAWFSGTRIKNIAMITAAIGVLLILLFNNPDKKLLIRPLLGLWEMYNTVSGLLGDVLSYIRLFALSLAGGLLGGAINLIATMVRGDDPGLLSWFFMLLVLVIGHCVNFALAALGAFVHPLRLTFVEFYKAVGFTGGGKAYTPYGGKTL